MGAFNINITGVGGHGCDRSAKEGQKLYGRCGRFTCPDCAAYDFVQRLRQSGMVRDGDNAYSVSIGPELIDRIKAKGLWPESVGGAEPNYFEVRDPELLPDGATHISVRTYSDGRYEVWAQYPQIALFTHWPQQPGTVVDDMLKNERRSGQF